jgi:hypothetical protein
MSSPENRDPLLPWIDRWAEETPRLPHSVEPEVWRRIVRAERSASEMNWLQRINAAFARPSFAFAFVIGCLLLGLFFGEIRASRINAEYGARLARSYLTLVDPLLAEPAIQPPKP